MGSLYIAWRNHLPNVQGSAQLTVSPLLWSLLLFGRSAWVSGTINTRLWQSSTQLLNEEIWCKRASSSNNEPWVVRSLLSTLELKRLGKWQYLIYPRIGRCRSSFGQLWTLRYELSSVMVAAHHLPQYPAELSGKLGQTAAMMVQWILLTLEMQKKASSRQLPRGVRCHNCTDPCLEQT